jgi:tetratricopeptide (TPR) repeat protein
VFAKYRWLEVAYVMSGHFVVLFIVAMVAGALVGMPPEGRGELLHALAPYSVALAAGGLFVAAAFGFGILCSIPPLLLICGRAAQAEKLYRWTLRMRSKSPFGKPRVNVWKISIANCLRDEQKYEEAEAMYKEIINATPPNNLLDALTNHGLPGAAAENYIVLLQRTNRAEEAKHIHVGRALWDLRAKYAFVSIVVLVGGCTFAIWLSRQLAELAR